MGNKCFACCNTSSTSVVSIKTNETKEIDRMLQQEAMKDQLHFKILCLGAGESGKSTIIKQLTFIHKQVLTRYERLSYIRVLQNNTVQCLITLIKEAESFGYPLSSEEQQSADFIMNHDQRTNMPKDMVNDIALLWATDTIKQTWSRRTEFWHLEATEYYFANCERFVDENFIPTDEDIVMARKRTTGVVVTELDYGGVHWSVVDVGGQRSERRKWLNCFDNVKAIIYTVNLAGYCSVLFEDKAVIRMHESLNLFEQTMANPAFANTPVYLFLNKKDLFESLIRNKPISCCFPDYQGDNSLYSSIDYIAQQFQKRLPDKHSRAIVLLLAARVKKDVGYCFEEVKDSLLEFHKKEIAKNQRKLAKAQQKYMTSTEGVNKLSENGEKDKSQFSDEDSIR